MKTEMYPNVTVMTLVDAVYVHDLSSSRGLSPGSFTQDTNFRDSPGSVQSFTRSRRTAWVLQEAAFSCFIKVMANNNQSERDTHT